MEFDNEDIIVISVLAILVIFLVLFVMSIRDGYKREAWLKEHCHVIGKMSGSTGFGVSSGGHVVTTFDSDKTGYMCDDGLQYWE